MACCVRIRKGETWRRFSEDCGKPTKVTHEGKEYCGVHNPLRKMAKDAERQARWAAEHEVIIRRVQILKACEGLTVEQVKAALTSAAQSVEPPKE